MAINLTGDFDVVAEFSTPAINRVLAAMHRAQRFLHSITISVDDTMDDMPPGPKRDKFSILGRVDEFGEPIVDHTKIGKPIPVSGQLAATDPTFRLLDPVVNPELMGATVGRFRPSNLKGGAQLQLSPPTIDVANTSGSKVTVGMQVMARYLADPNTRPLSEFVRGPLQITAPVSQVASQSANVISVDLKVDDVDINFSPVFWSSPLSERDLAEIKLLIRNALKTSFLPTTYALPPKIDYLRLKALVGSPNAIGLMLNMASFDPKTGVKRDPGNPGDPDSMNTNFLVAGDDFAFAVSAGFMLGKIRFAPIENRSVPFYNLTFRPPAVEFQPGKIVLTVKGHAARKRYTPTQSFDFKATLAFTLKLVSTTTGGALNTADLVPEGDVSIDVPWYIDAVEWLVDVFRKGDIQKERDRNLADMQQQIRDAMDVNKNLGGFIDSLVGRVRVGEPIVELIDSPRGRTLRVSQVRLAYTSVEINSSGVILHGSLAVRDWPLPNVEFEQIQSTSSTRPEYSALKSWIPGGTIERYEWKRGQGPPFSIDRDHFVLQIPDIFQDPDERGRPRVVKGFIPTCLTVWGTQLSASGPVAYQSVTATTCQYSSFPFLNGVTSVPLTRELPLVALTQPGPGGLVQVTGHASARSDEGGGDTPNLIVHFADEQTAGHLDLLTQALRESRREDAPTGVLVVVKENHLTKARYSEGVIYTEEQGGVWDRLFKVKIARRPQTLIVGPNGDTLWQQEGELDIGTLAAVLHRVLVKGEPIRPGILQSSLRRDQPPPNFLLENGLTLRDFVGRRVEPVFWKSASKPSIETVRDRQEAARKAEAQEPVVLAISDDAPELAKKIAAENGLSATLVTDPERNITRAYGIKIWPTRLLIDEFGLVREIHYGRFAGEPLAYPSREKVPPYDE